MVYIFMGIRTKKNMDINPKINFLASLDNFFLSIRSKKCN
jgi:hypothetical protein